jgi:biopolymer transport protein ExbD
MRFSGVTLAVLVTMLATGSCGMTEVPVPIALRVHISPTGECTVIKVSMPCEGLGAYVKELNAQPGCDIHLEVDRQSQYQFVVVALSSLQKAGFKNVGFTNDGKEPQK